MTCAPSDVRVSTAPMSRSVYMLIIGLVILFGLMFLFSTMASDQPTKPMTAEVTGATLTPSQSAPKAQ